MEGKGLKRSSEADGDDGRHTGLLDGVRAIVVNIDGAITPSTYFKETIIPYVNENVESYVTTHFGSESMVKVISGLRTEAAANCDAGVDGAVLIPDESADTSAVAEAVASYVKWQLNSGLFPSGKISMVGLLMLEMLRSAYKSNSIHGQFYPDVKKGLKKLSEEDMKVYALTFINCVEAVKLGLEYSTEGDLTELFAGYYDASLGVKLDMETYANLVAKLDLIPEEILYLTHDAAEAVEVQAAGLKAGLIARSDNPKFTSRDLAQFRCIKSFEDLVAELDASPRKKHRVQEKKGTGEHEGHKECTGAENDDKVSAE